MRLNHRLYDGDYTTLLKNPKYYCIFKIKNLCSRRIKFLEQEVLKITLNYKSDEWGLEVREGISQEDFINIVEGVLNKYGVIYEIEYAPEFPKPDKVIKEKPEEIEPLEMVPIEEGIPYPEFEGKFIMRDDVQITSYNVFKTKFDMNIYFQGVYFLATGLGKTYIAFACCIYHLSKYPNDNILWVTYRKDIIDSQDIDKILGNRVIKYNESNFNPDFINQERGKIIIVLRQSLRTKYKDLNDNLFQGFIYDECHDACKVSVETNKVLKNGNIETKKDGITFDVLNYLKDHNNFRYFIGFSATPLTSNDRQNAGLHCFYGEIDSLKINYLHKCSLIEGYEKGLLLKPLITYESIPNIRELFNEINKEHSELEQYEDCIQHIIHCIETILNDERLYYKKGIIWFPTIEICNLFYSRCNFEDIKKYVSHSKIKNSDEKNFKKENNNSLIFSCDKFTTGFDCPNLEFGINFKLTEAGNVTVQKLGRCTRKKDNQNTAFLFQFTEKIDETELINCLIKNLEALGMNIDDILRYVRFYEKEGGSGNKTDKNHNTNVLFDIQKFELTKDIIDNHIDFNKQNTDTNLKIRHLVRKYNDNVQGDLLENLHSGKYIIDMKSIEEFLGENRLSKYLDEVKYSIEYCFKKELFERIIEILYNKTEFINICNKNNITSNNYLTKTNEFQKLPPWTLINDGFYNGEPFDYLIQPVQKETWDTW